MNASSYLSVSGASHAELVEKKSQFIGDLAPVQSKAQAEDFIANMRVRYKGARHYTFAYRLFGGDEHCSDDGEPQGTAGVPILELLRREKLFGVCLVVTRYFGGILLGAGGLHRAYSACAKATKEKAQIVTYALCREMTVTLSYAHYDRVARMLKESGFSIQKPVFEKEVIFQVYIPAPQVPIYADRLIAFCAGECTIKEGKEIYQETAIK